MGLVTQWCEKAVSFVSSSLVISDLMRCFSLPLPCDTRLIVFSIFTIDDSYCINSFIGLSRVLIRIEFFGVVGLLVLSAMLVYMIFFIRRMDG